MTVIIRNKREGIIHVHVVNPDHDASEPRDDGSTVPQRPFLTVPIRKGESREVELAFPDSRELLAMLDAGDIESDELAEAAETRRDEKRQAREAARAKRLGQDQQPPQQPQAGWGTQPPATQQ